jgi:hypothetical protein
MLQSAPFFCLREENQPRIYAEPCFVKQTVSLRATLKAQLSGN